MTYSEILAETQFLLGLEDDTNFAIYTREQMTRHSNRALDELTSIILRVDGSWQWDDKNHPDLPIAITDLVDNQGQYTLDANLTVNRLEITSESGSRSVLEAIDETDVNITLDEYMEQTGTPTYFDKVGESLFLYPKPNYDLVGGMRIYFNRPASYFETTDVNKEPGFAEIFHEFIPVWNAAHYASTQKDMNDTYTKMENKLKKITDAIKKHYSLRRKRGRITPYVPQSI